MLFLFSLYEFRKSAHYLVDCIFTNLLVCFFLFLVFFSLCVILFTKQGQHEKEKLVLRLFAKDKKYLQEKRVQFFYLYEDVQREFLQDLTEAMNDDRCADNATAPKVLNNSLFYDRSKWSRQISAYPYY